MAYKGRFIHTLTIHDVGQTIIHTRGMGTISIEGLMGHVQPHDVGKQLFEHEDIISIENNDQRDRRLNLNDDRVSA